MREGTQVLGALGVFLEKKMRLVNQMKNHTMAELEIEVLRVLADRPGMGCGAIGNVVYKDEPGRANCSCPWARIVGKVMKRLIEKGNAKPMQRGYAITSSGAARIEE
ncbi:MAG: hypothetical protein AAFN70_16870 [Planctomycetota bacterium]